MSPAMIVLLFAGFVVVVAVALGYLIGSTPTSRICDIQPRRERKWYCHNPTKRQL